MNRQYTTYGYTDGPYTSHYGKLVDTDFPTTGVLSVHSIEWLDEELYSEHSVDLGWEDAVEELGEDSPELEMFESEGPWLIGDWRKDKDGLWEEYAGDCGYSAIVREDVVQIVLSKHTARGAWCSPCYPGQVDLDTDGDVLAYTLPADLIGEER